MKSIKVAIGKIKTNPDNPRIIKDHKFNQLVESIKKFPKMLELRPIVVNDQMVVLGGNMRLKACEAAKMKTVPVVKASGLTAEEQKEFIIKDNNNFGEWDWDMLADQWESEDLESWGMDVWKHDELDYSALDEDNDQELDKMRTGVRKAIMIEFELDDYEEAAFLVKHFREKGAYVGSMLIKHLKAEKGKE